MVYFGVCLLLLLLLLLLVLVLLLLLPLLLVVPVPVPVTAAGAVVWTVAVTAVLTFGNSCMYPLCALSLSLCVYIAGWRLR